MQKNAFLLSADDATVVSLAADGDSEAFELLAQRMTPMMHATARRYRNVPGLEPEDLLQEGLLGLLAAVHAYKESNGSFSAFATTCIRNRMLSLLRRHMPAGDFELPEGEEILSALPDSGQADPAALVVAQEEAERLFFRLREQLTPLEYRVLTAHLAGRRYKEIAKSLAVSEKTVDNALQRVRQKLSKNGLR